MFTFIDNKKELGFINNLVPKYENKNNILDSINIIEKIKGELVPSDIINNFIKKNIIINNKTQKNIKHKNKKTHKTKESKKSRKHKIINSDKNITKKNKSTYKLI